jgi:hypothetical protein
MMMGRIFSSTNKSEHVYAEICFTGKTTCGVKSTMRMARTESVNANDGINPLRLV